jgi:hypothetical protein
MQEALVVEFNLLTLSQKRDLLVRYLPMKSNLPKVTFPFQAIMFPNFSREIISMICLILGYEDDDIVDEAVSGFMNRFFYQLSTFREIQLF